MKRAWSLLVCLVLVLGLGFSMAPRPCLGDRAGQACQADACQCDAACTCHLAHARARLETELAQMSVCRRGSTPVQRSQLQALAEQCHGPGPGRHFGPPSHSWTAALPAALAPWLVPAGLPALQATWPPALYPMPARARPPWPLA